MDNKQDRDDAREVARVDLTEALDEAREGARTILISRASKDELLAIKRQTWIMLIAIVMSMATAFGLFFYVYQNQRRSSRLDSYKSCQERNDATVQFGASITKRIRIIQQDVSDPELKSALIKVLTVDTGNFELPDCTRWLH